MKKAAICLALVSACAFAADAHAAKKSDVTVHNKSEWAINHFFLSPIDDEQWGSDQLGDEVINKGEEFTLTGVPCDSYDVKLVDEDGDECVVEEVDICGSDDDWVITDEDLLDCEGY
ncbi:MAG TPA: hypothetical protein VN493_25720 [Thermoanaerobaculia bacterium]|nr:hypothetical protein [Thermoanaerobaculia bacterium]